MEINLKPGMNKKVTNGDLIVSNDNSLYMVAYINSENAYMLVDMKRGNCGELYETVEDLIDAYSYAIERIIKSEYIKLYEV